MRKQLITRATLGVLLGVLMLVIICALFNRKPDGTIYFYSSEFADRVGSPTAAILLQLLVIGLYGAFCMAGTLLYGIERWPLALATAVHYVIVAGFYPVVGSICCWGMGTKDVLIVEGLQLAGFIIIWLIMFSLYRAKVRELNAIREMMENTRDASKSPGMVENEAGKG